MIPYIQNYIDVVTGKSWADENTKAHFKKMLHLEADKITPLVLECKAKGLDVNIICPKLMQDYIDIIEAIAE